MWYQRIKYHQVPAEPEKNQRMMQIARGFLQADVNRIHAFRFTYIPTGDVRVEVYSPNEIKQQLELIDTYNAGQLHLYEQRLRLIEGGNSSGNIENEKNLLINGLFNDPENPLKGWSITSQTGSLSIKTEKGRVIFEDAGPNEFEFVNTALLTNLETHSISALLDEMSANTQFKFAIGGQEGSAHISAGVKNEQIIASGTQFKIKGSFTDTNHRVVLSYVIVNKK